MRLQLAAFSLVAAVCLGLYWPGLVTWFSADDFAWLGLRLSIDSFADLLSALFAPKAQGTVRPFSERLYFLLLEKAFGMEALPFRIVAFATQLANLWMVIHLTRRVTGSLAAGAIAAVAWTANSAIGQAMSWSSAYNQILWPATLLAALNCRWTWLTQGSARARRWEWILFLFGFGVLEMQVVYPLLAGCLTWLFHRERWRELLPLFAVAAAYAVGNRLLAKPQANPLYMLYWDSSITVTLAKYSRMLFGVWRPGQELNAEPWQFVAEKSSMFFAAVALAWAAWKRDRWAAFGAAWFLITLLPVLPLRDKVSDYYLTVPSLGLGFVIGAAFARYPLLAMVPVLVYAASSATLARKLVDYNYERAEIGRRLVEGIKQIKERHPGKVILLANVSSDAYWSTVNDGVFRLLGGTEIYLTPGSEESIPPQPGLGDPTRFVAAPAVAMLALKEDRAVVYSASGAKLKNVTAAWKMLGTTLWENAMAPVVDLSQPALQSQLGDGWYHIEDFYRWSQPRALLRLGPIRGRAEFFVRAFRPVAGDARPAVTVRALLNGVPVAEWQLQNAGEELSASAPVPPGIDTSKPVQVEILISPPIEEPGGGGRQLGLVFGSVGIRSISH